MTAGSMSELTDALSAAKVRSVAEVAGSVRPRDGSQRRLLMRRVMQQAAADFKTSWWNHFGREYSDYGNSDKDMWRYIAECTDAALAAWGYVDDIAQETGATS